ncbi:MAG: site-specific integrase [Acidobacteria bacterium]|nr:site-specific integrase [Acidobacteriota bacterium]
MGICKEKNHQGRVRYVVSRYWPQDSGRLRKYAPTHEAAKALLRRVEQAIFDGTWQRLRGELKGLPEVTEEGERPVVTFSNFADNVFVPNYAKVANRNWIDKEYRLGHLKKFFNDRPLASIQLTDLMAYKKWRQEAGVTNATINRELACLSKLCVYALDIAAIKFNPMPNRCKWALKESPKASKIPTLEEYWLLVESIPAAETAALVALIGECGLRVSEALKLEKNLVDKQRRMLTVHYTKDSEPRTIPLSPFALEKLMTVPNVLGQPYLIINPKTGRRYRSIRGSFEAALIRSGLEGITLKSLRNFRGTQWAMDGVDLRTIQELMGHSDVRTTIKHYARYQKQHAFKVVMKVQQQEFQQRCTGEKQEVASLQA